jgi:hypothetical protein
MVVLAALSNWKIKAEDLYIAVCCGANGRNGIKGSRALVG